jgi:hypothetical protein
VERGGQSVGKVREWCVERWHLQGCSPHLWWLRTDGLAPASKYWTYRSHADVMGPVSWCSYVTTWPKPLSPTPRLSWGRGLRWPKTMAGLVCPQSPRLLPGVGACFVLVETSRMLPMRTTWDVWSGTKHESSIEIVWHVDRVFRCRVYIDSNHRDSQIWVPLVCGSHHVDNLTNSMSLLVTDVVLLNILNCLQLLYD